MSEIFSKIGSFISGPTGGGLLKGGAVGAGLLQNLMANRQMEQKQKFIQDLVTNPAKFAAYVQSLEKPLSKGLTTEVGREAQAFGAERGLSSSPAIMQDVFAQSLAPFQQNEQQMAIQQALQGLGIYGSTPTKTPVDMTSLLKMLMSGGGGSKPGPFGSTPPAVLGGAPGGQIPVQGSPIPDETIPSVPGGSDASTFDFSNLLQNGALSF